MSDAAYFAAAEEDDHVHVFIWNHVGWTPCDEWWRERSFRGKARGPRRGAPFLDGRMALFVVVEKSSALCVAGRESAELSRPRTTLPVRLLIDFMENTPARRSEHSNKSPRYTPASSPLSRRSK